MGAQPDLFDYCISTRPRAVATPAARRADPESSHQAAEIHTLNCYAPLRGT